MAAVHPRHGKQRGNDGEETLSAEKANKLLRCASFGLTKSANMIAKVARAKIYAKVVKKHLSTRTMPGEEKKDLPGPADYDVTDARDIANAKGGVEFGGKNITRELTAVDPTYSAQLKTPGPGEYNIDQSERKNDWGGVAGLRRVPSMKFAMSDRMREQRVLYLGKGTEIMAKDTPGPGTYSGTNFSSFRGVNPYGPPHTFGATNHMQTYETASPGPLRYNVVKPSAYSPQFGFGASQRGELPFQLTHAVGWLAGWLGCRRAVCPFALRVLCVLLSPTTHLFLHPHPHRCGRRGREQGVCGRGFHAAGPHDPRTRAPTDVHLRREEGGAELHLRGPHHQAEVPQALRQTTPQRVWSRGQGIPGRWRLASCCEREGCGGGQETKEEEEEGQAAHGPSGARSGSCVAAAKARCGQGLLVAVRRGEADEGECVTRVGSAVCIWRVEWVGESAVCGA